MYRFVHCLVYKLYGYLDKICTLQHLACVADRCAARTSQDIAMLSSPNETYFIFVNNHSEHFHVNLRM